MGSFHRRTFSYDKLPAEPIRLSVLKLDGSSFDVYVMTSATVGDLKLAIETAFSHIPKKGPSKISWSHVWGHFCLCFEGQKLVNDTECIGSYGLKEGDQIRFKNHVSGDATILSKGYSRKSRQKNLVRFGSREVEEDIIDDHSHGHDHDHDHGRSHDHDWDDIEKGGIGRKLEAEMDRECKSCLSSTFRGCSVLGFKDLFGSTNDRAYSYYSLRDTWRDQ